MASGEKGGSRSTASRANVPRTRAAPASTPRLGTTRQAAEHLDVSDRYLRELAERRIVPPRTAKGWDLDATKRAYEQHVRAVAAGRAQREQAPDKPSKRGSLFDEQTRLNAAKADAQEMKNARERGELVEVARVVQAVIAAWAKVRSKLLAIPRNAAPLLVGIESESVVEAALGEHIREVLDELASTRNLPVGVTPVDLAAGDVGGVDAAAAAERERVGGRRARAQSRKQRDARQVANRSR